MRDFACGQGELEQGKLEMFFLVTPLEGLPMRGQGLKRYRKIDIDRFESLKKSHLGLFLAGMVQVVSQYSA